MSSGGPRDEGDTEAAEAPLVAVIDDDPSVLQSIGRLIRVFGYRAETFASGQEFLSSDCVAQAACLILDVRMPEMDGLEVQRRLAARGARIPILFLTGRASDDEERRARSAGARAFLRKPLREATLRSALENAIHASAPLRGGHNGE